MKLFFFWAKFLLTGCEDKNLINSLIWIDTKIDFKNCSLHSQESSNTELHLNFVVSAFWPGFLFHFVSKESIYEGLKCSRILSLDFIISQVDQILLHLWGASSENQSMYMYVRVCVHVCICTFILCSPVTGPSGF